MLLEPKISTSSNIWFSGPRDVKIKFLAKNGTRPTKNHWISLKLLWFQGQTVSRSLQTVPTTWKILQKLLWFQGPFKRNAHTWPAKGQPRLAKGRPMPAFAAKSAFGPKLIQSHAFKAQGRPHRIPDAKINRNHTSNLKETFGESKCKEVRKWPRGVTRSARKFEFAILRNSMIYERVWRRNFYWKW